MLVKVPNTITKETLDDLLANVGNQNYQLEFGGRTFKGVLASVQTRCSFEDFIEVEFSIDPYPERGPTHTFKVKYIE